MNNAALSAVKKRRAAFPTQGAAPAPNQQQQQPKLQAANFQQQQQQDMQRMAESMAQPRSLALKDAIYLFDSRILNLEKMVLDIKTGGSLGVSQPPVAEVVKQSLKEHVEEFDHRYEMLATEIVDLKEAFMKLQTFTMDINKSLEEMDEQIRILIEGPEQDGVGANDEGSENISAEIME